MVHIVFKNATFKKNHHYNNCVTVFEKNKKIIQDASFLNRPDSFCSAHFSVELTYSILCGLHLNRHLVVGGDTTKHVNYTILGQKAHLLQELA